MTVQKALGRFALWVAWTLQVTIWALGATALFLSAAIDIGEKRYPIYFTYTTPLYLNDVLDMMYLFTTLSPRGRAGAARHALRGLVL